MSLWLTKKERASPLIILKVTVISDLFIFFKRRDSYIPLS